MAKKKNIELWEIVDAKRMGRPPAFEDAEELWLACVEYFKWVKQNPLWEQRLVTSKGESVTKELPKMRAMTINAMCLHIGITHETWLKYRKKENFSLVISKADNVIYSQKFEGASADLLNANIISRDLGLKEQTKVESDTNHTFNVTRRIKSAD